MSKPAASAASAANTSIFGRFVLDTAFIFGWCRRNPQVLAVTCTGVGCTGLYWRNVRRCEQRMLESQTLISRESQAAVEGAEAKLHTLMREWGAEGERKDLMLTRLHSQNIQQTRSLDRIMTMLQVCRVEVENLPTWPETRSSRNVFTPPVVAVAAPVPAATPTPVLALAPATAPPVVVETVSVPAVVVDAAPAQESMMVSVVAASASSSSSPSNINIAESATSTSSSATIVAAESLSSALTSAAAAPMISSGATSSSNVLATSAPVSITDAPSLATATSEVVVSASAAEAFTVSGAAAAAAEIEAQQAPEPSSDNTKQQN